MRLLNVDGDEVWRWLRATRWNPPSAAAGDQTRRKTYVAALGQAEQLFRAASAAGPAARPLPLFYGLSQAGRAIAAAASSLVEEDGWRLEGHGIRQVRGTLAGPLPDVHVTTDKPGGTGSFVRLSEILGSPVWKNAALTLGVLWDSLPENREWPLTDAAARDRRIPLQVEYGDLSYPETHPLASVPVWPLPPWVVTSDSADPLRQYMRSFPDAAGYDYPRRDAGSDATPDFTVHQDGWGELRMHWRVPEGSAGSHADRLALVSSMTRPYARAKYFFPALGANTTSLHPLMAWWAVLHTLSMLARYQPAEWEDHIDVDRSRFSVPIESLLEVAIAVVPKLIAYTIDGVCDGELTSR